MNFATQIRHFLTFLSGLGTILFAHRFIAPESVASVNDAGAQLIVPLTVIIGAVGASIGRLVISGLQLLASKVGIKLGGFSSGVGLLMCACAVLGMGSLASCRTFTTTAPDGSVTTVRQVDQSAVTQGAGIADGFLSRFFPTQQTTAPTAVPVTNEK